MRLGWISAVPLGMTAMCLLIAPELVVTLAKNGWGAHLLRGVRLIESEDFAS